MSTKTRILMAAAVVAFGTAAQAAEQGAAPNESASSARKPTLATAAKRQLRQDDAATAQPAPAGVKAQADADSAARDARDKRPRLEVRRQNLKGRDAAREIRQQTNPNTIDRATAYGDKDHTEQVTNLQITVKKK